MSDRATKVFPVHIKARGDGRVETIISTGALDRERDRILPSAWRLEHFVTNPVVLWSHDYQAPPVARSIDVRVVNGALRTVDEFPPRGIYPLADTVHDLITAGYIHSKSVGFRPLQWRPNDEGGRDYTEVELLESSYVAVPANPEAVVVARSKGIQDRVALTQFFGAPRGSGDLMLVDPDQVRNVCRDVLKSQVAQAVRGHRPVLLIDEPEPWLVDLGGGRVREIAPRAFTAAVAQAVGQLVGTALHKALCRATGRVD